MPFSLRYPDISLHLQWTSFEKKSGSGDMAEAFEWKSHLALDQIQALYVYGIGLGHYAEVLLDWLKEDASRQLIFLEDDLAALEAFSHVPHAKEIVDHPQIHLRFVSKNWDMVLEQCAAEFSFDKIEVSVQKAYEKHARFKKIKLSLLRKTVLWNALTTETVLSHLLHENIIPNLRRIPECSYVNHWKDAFKGVPIIICGAGPSLKTIAEELRKARDRALIIACGSALSALSHLNIRPHLGIAIDPNERELHCLSGCSFRDLPLLFGSRLYPKVFELFNGPYGYIRSGTGGSLESYVEQELGLTEPYLGYDLGREALSVTTLALSLAQFWGCGPIIFAGVDMAYAREKHYADGVPVKAQLETSEKRSSDQMIRRKGASGQMVTTLVKWVMEQETIDRYAKNHPETSFFNVSTGGLGFKQIPHKPLSEILYARECFQKFFGQFWRQSRSNRRSQVDSYCMNTDQLAKPAVVDFSELSRSKLPQNLLKTLPSCNYDEKIRHLFQKTKIQKSEGEIEQILASLSQSLEKCLELFKLLQQEEHGSGKSVLYETDLETEIAYQLVLGASKQVLERRGLEKWKFLEEAANSYLEAMKGQRKAPLPL